MGDAFELVEPHLATAYLKRFPEPIRRIGEAFFAKGCVENLVPKEPGTAYAAQVLEQDTEDVRIEYDPGEGWYGNCTCEKMFDCEHVYAVTRALIAEHSAATVRNLSAGVVQGAVAGKAEKRSASNRADLAERLAAQLGRKLSREEVQFIRSVREVHKRCSQSRQISYWDFERMGLEPKGYGWSALQIWPAFPEDEYEFWLYVANAAKEQGAVIPEFMEGITDLSLIEGRLARWRRAREVEKWKQTLGRVRLEPVSTDLVEIGETDLRLVLADKEMWLERQRSGAGEFEILKPQQWNQLRRDHEEGRVRFTNEGELIWQFLYQRFYYGATHLRYGDLETKNALGRILRTRLLDSRVVDLQGQVLGRPAEPLRWQVAEAASDEEDYRLWLAQADGSRPPPIRCIMPGRPSLYLTAHAVFTGPSPQEHLLDPANETRIPAPAIERTSGVAFLRGLGAELPPRLSQRVRVLPYQVSIQCELRPIHSGKGGEECAVSVLAEAPDGHQHSWTGYNWLESRPEPARNRKPSDPTITLYDSSVLSAVPPVLEPLQLKPSFYNSGLAARITKKFPDVFAAWLKTVPPAYEVQLLGDLASLANAEVAGRVQLEVSEEEIDWFDLRVVLNVSDTTLTQEEIALLLKAKGSYVRLKGKGWRRLQFDLSEEDNERLARLGLSARELSAEPQRLHALQLADDAAKRFLPAQQVEQIQRRAGELKARVSPELPAGVTAQFRPYQLEGFHFLAYLATNRFGGILADDMGLGKTLQTLAWLVWLKDGGTDSAETAAAGDGRTPILVVCPKSVMDNWQAEAARFTPELRVKTWSAAELDNFLERLGEADLHVLNYAQLRLLGETLTGVHWLAVILDEGQYIKNPSSQTAQVARALRADYRLVLTGTPIENQLLDLWSLMAFVMPGVLGSRTRFGRLYDSKGDPWARRRLASRVRPFLLRRTKAQVAQDLPERIEEDLYCEIEGEQMTLYRAELKKAQQLLLAVKTQKELAQFQFHFLTSLLRLRQVCCHPRLVSPESRAASAKVEALVEQLEPLMEEGEKVLVFSQFVELLELLRPALAERKWPMFYLTGSTENRGELVQQFQSAEGPGVFLISLKAGGFGLNLTAASYVVLFDPWWNPAVENQAIDRTHRIGQTQRVIAYRLLIKNSIEEKIRHLQKQKKALAEEVLGEERFAQSLTLEDLRFLFAD